MTDVVARSSETVSESQEETSTVADDAGKHRLEKWRREARRLRAALLSPGLVDEAAPGHETS